MSQLEPTDSQTYYVFPASMPLAEAEQDRLPVVDKVTWRLEKFEGDPPAPGDEKRPFEIIEGGDDLLTRRLRLAADGILTAIYCESITGSAG